MLDVRSMDARWQTSMLVQRIPTLATGQVGMPYADEGERAGVSRRCVTAPPSGRYAAGDTLGRAAFLLCW